MALSASIHAAVLAPVDQATADAGFAAFRAELLDAIERRDGEHVRTIVAHDVRVSFGGDDGIEGFRRQWDLDDARSPFWDEFGAVLRLGGVFVTPDEFRAPYVYTNWPESIDAFQHVAVTATDVPVREEPSVTAPVVTTLGHAVVRLGAQWPALAWRRVELPDGRNGYVHERFVRSPVDYRASFVRNDGVWRLRFFVAGD